MVKIVAGELDRLVQNVLLYTNAKAIRLQEVLLVANNGKLQAFSCDDYIAVGDWIEIDSEDSREFALSIQEAERLGEWIKKDKKVIHKTELKVQFFNTYFKVTTDDEVEKFEYIDPNWDAWDLVLEMLTVDDQEPKLILDFAVRPDRFAKIARLKADKEAPVVFRGIDINGHLLLQFKKGLSLVGCAMPIDQSYVQEEFLWNDWVKPSLERIDQSAS